MRVGIDWIVKSGGYMKEKSQVVLGKGVEKIRG